MVIRWLIMLFACLIILGVGIVFELGFPGSAVCPQGWWRESPGFCAFPFVSIITSSFAYGFMSLLLLITVAVLAPVRKFTASIVLLVALALWPIYIFIFDKLSWFALVSLSSVIAIATCFILGAYVTHNPAFKRDSPRSGRAP